MTARVTRATREAHSSRYRRKIVFPSKSNCFPADTKPEKTTKPLEKVDKRSDGDRRSSSSRISTFDRGSVGPLPPRSGQIWREQGVGRSWWASPPDW
ncbi:hypothetical protein A4A49_24939 [Nicotiana attenuata]|uniref:Uncharacterized protein n=1 Tax=Nicotiana attenuata TaxID=49451 RepID=A0A1J6KDH4_NICAT|nr:hypothetical protein A4A49_24939 [Nicotiana attenuata]